MPFYALERRKRKAAGYGRLNQPAMMRYARIATAVVATAVLSFACEFQNYGNNDPELNLCCPAVETKLLRFGIWKFDAVL